MKGLPNQIEGFWGDNPTHQQIILAHQIAHIIIISVILTLIWTIVELYKGNKNTVRCNKVQLNLVN